MMDTQSACRFSVWWNHKRKTFTTTRQAAFAAFGEATATAQERIRELESQLTAATERAEKSEADAERYRGLRDFATGEQIDMWSCHLPEQQDQYADEIIRAARLQEQPK